jgi:hypothetical protein
MVQTENTVGDATSSTLLGPTRIHAAWLVLPCLACDFLMMPVLTSLFSGPPTGWGMAIGMGIVGCVLAQGCLLAAWLAWSEGPFLWRLANHWEIAIGLYLVWFVGFILALFQLENVLDIAVAVAFGVPLVSIAAQFPLWIARQWLGWRLVRERHDEVHRHEPPLAIRDLMLATLVVAASLALARLAPSPDAGSMWPIWAFAFVIASVVSALAMLPAGKMLLRSQHFDRGLFRSVLYGGAWIALVWIIVAVKWLFFPSALVPRVLYVGLSSLIFSYAATVVLAAAIARSRGYRLSGRRMSLLP